MYKKRIADEILGEYLDIVPAVSMLGAKGVGKTETAMRLAKTILRLDIDTLDKTIASDKKALEKIKNIPILIDEWSREPVSWDIVRRIVDDKKGVGKFILTGSASGNHLNIHSGAGRIVNLKMRPLSFIERFPKKKFISLNSFFKKNPKNDLFMRSDKTVEDYAYEIFASGFPGIHDKSERGIKLELRNYIENIASKEFIEQGFFVRKPEVLKKWMRSYAAATSTNATYERILDAATPGEGNKPSKGAVLSYRDLLDNLFITDRVPPWLPTGTDIRTFAKAEKHFLVDSGLALALLRLDYRDLLKNKKLGAFNLEKGNTLFGKFFESLVCSSLKTYCDKSDLDLCHYRSSDGRREIDFIIEEKNHVLAIEVKGNRIPSSDDFKHLNWLESKISPKRKITKILINIGDGAYRDKSGVFIVPLDLLGP